MALLMNTETIQSHSMGISFRPANRIVPDKSSTAAVLPSHKNPAPSPIRVLFSGDAIRCRRSFLFSGSQNSTVHPAADRNGISSAQNLHIAAFSVSGSGSSPVSTAQPTKNPTAFATVMQSFFMSFCPFQIA